MMSEIIKFQSKGIKMIRLKGLNKILRIGLLAGALLALNIFLLGGIINKKFLANGKKNFNNVF